MKSEDSKGSDFELIELVDVCRSYGYGDAESFALKNFSMTVKRGEFIMIMGPSGCGKTTLLNILGLLDKPTSGTYYLNGKKVNRFTSRGKSRLRAKSIGFIFQDFNLIPNLTVIENVALPLVYSGTGKTHRLIQASDTLKRFNLGEREYFFPHQLSGGQKQRVAIARSLVSKPEIILADEPTGNLDSRSSHIVMEELRRIHSEGNTIIMVTHNPNLTTYATRVIHMLDGGIDEDIKTVSDEDLPVPVHEREVNDNNEAFTSEVPMVEADTEKFEERKSLVNNHVDEADGLGVVSNESSEESISEPKAPTENIHGMNKNEEKSEEKSEKSEKNSSHDIKDKESSKNSAKKSSKKSTKKSSPKTKSSEDKLHSTGDPGFKIKARPTFEELLEKEDK